MNNYNKEHIILTRNCESTLIPFGEAYTLKEGSEVYITQSLGGSYTVMFNGSMFRIEGKDADAIGKTVVKNDLEDKELSGEAREGTIWEVLKTCYDPEIPVNMVDLGLIYSCDLTHLDTGGTDVDIKMTLTAPGCGMGPMMVDELRTKVMGVSNVNKVEVELVWDPPWSQYMISEAARLELGMY